MAWPPVVPPATRANATPILDTHPADHNAISTALSDIVAQLNATPWIALPFAAGWSNFGSGYQGGQYRKVGDMVQVRGLISRAAIAPPVAVTTALPAGYRPTSLMQFAAVGGGLVVTLTMDTAGVMTAVGISAGTISTLLFLTTGWSVTA